MLLIVALIGKISVANTFIDHGALLQHLPKLLHLLIALRSGNVAHPHIVSRLGSCMDLIMPAEIDTLYPSQMRAPITPTMSGWHDDAIGSTV